MLNCSCFYLQKTSNTDGYKTSFNNICIPHLNVSVY